MLGKGPDTAIVRDKENAFILCLCTVCLDLFIYLFIIYVKEMNFRSIFLSTMANILKSVYKRILHSFDLI